MVKLQLYDVPKEILGGILRYPWPKAAQVIKATRDLIREKKENRVSVYMMIHIYDDGWVDLMLLYFIISCVFDDV